MRKYLYVKPLGIMLEVHGVEDSEYPNGKSFYSYSAANISDELRMRLDHDIKLHNIKTINSTKELNLEIFKRAIEATKQNDIFEAV